MIEKRHRVGWVLALLLATGLAGCGGGVNPSATTSASSGQVGHAGAAGMTRYAAARAADQVSFGATPALVNDLATQGLDSWITTQMALPPTLMATPPSWVISYDSQDEVARNRAFNFPPTEFYRLTLASPDQLRLRVTWSLMQYIPITVKVPAYGRTTYFNLLQQHALGNYGDFIRELTVHPSMGLFLDNASNRPISAGCPSCAPNENYARELMQLFTLGVVKLNPDGTTIRDQNGKPMETYTQEDIEELAAALTGWRFAPSATPLPPSNGINAGARMVPESGAQAHDLNAKTVLGTTFPAGRNAVQDLDTVIAMLMQHPNIGPFVSLRLIQNLVTSNPTPQYVGRVSAVFRNNGQGVAGDMKAVIRAVLMDSEARRGDQPGADVSRFGKIREPVLWYTAALRGLGCSASLFEREPYFGPFNAPSVFGFYLPTDRAPGSNLLAPEQKLLNSNEFGWRLNILPSVLNNGGNAVAGCDLATLTQAFGQSTKTLIDMISSRWFRGAMPPMLRADLEARAVDSRLQRTPAEVPLILLSYALTSPYYGVIK